MGFFLVGCSLHPGWGPGWGRSGIETALLSALRVSEPISGKARAKRTPLPPWCACQLAVAVSASAEGRGAGRHAGADWASWPEHRAVSKPLPPCRDWEQRCLCALFRRRLFVSHSPLGPSTGLQTNYGGSASWCQTPGLGRLTQSMSPSLLRENLPPRRQLVVSPSSSGSPARGEGPD